MQKQEKVSNENHRTQWLILGIGIIVSVLSGVIHFSITTARDAIVAISAGHAEAIREQDRRLRVIEQTELRDKQSAEYVRELERLVNAYRSEAMVRRSHTDAKFNALDERLKRLERGR
jgi:hypothetical protein